MQSIPYFFSYAGHLFAGCAEYEPAEPATDTEPAIPAIATVLTVFLNGDCIECYEHINPSTIQALEQKIIKDMES